jgi:hypothetical protein
LKNTRTAAEIGETLEEMQVTLDVLAAHLGVSDQVQAALSTRRAKAERSRVEIERSLGQSIDSDDPRR